MYFLSIVPLLASVNAAAHDVADAKPQIMRNLLRAAKSCERTYWDHGSTVYHCIQEQCREIVQGSAYYITSLETLPLLDGEGDSFTNSKRFCNQLFPLDRDIYASCLCNVYFKRPRLEDGSSFGAGDDDYFYFDDDLAPAESACARAFAEDTDRFVDCLLDNDLASEDDHKYHFYDDDIEKDFSESSFHDWIMAATEDDLYDDHYWSFSEYSTHGLTESVDLDLYDLKPCSASCLEAMVTEAVQGLQAVQTFAWGVLMQTMSALQSYDSDRDPNLRGCRLK